jgi:hypothetical protein
MFRFTIRDVLWLMIVVGLLISLGWQYTAAAQWRSQSQQWESRANSAASALNGADRQNEWHGSDIVVIEPISGVPIQRVYKPTK